MADIDALLGVRLRTGKAARGETTPDPQPKRGRKATPEPQHEEPTAPTGPTAEEAREAKAAHRRQILNAVDHLGQLWAAADPTRLILPSASSGEDVDADTEESPAYVARLWTQRFEQEEWRRRLFGCNAPALARVVGTGVAIKAEIAPHVAPDTAIATFQRVALAIGAGHYGGGSLPGRGPRGGHLITLWREVVGTDPATAFRAVNHDTYLVYADLNERRQALWFNAGLAVRKRTRDVAGKPAYHYEFPRITECVQDHGRGPGFVVQLCKGQGIEDFEAALPKLRALLRVDVQVVERKPGVVELRLLHRPAVSFPSRVPLQIHTLARPTAESARILAAEHGLHVPVGVDSRGRNIEVPIRLRPHMLVSGASNSGKTSLLKSQLRALFLQGAELHLACGKRGPDMQELYDEGIAKSLALEPAVIYRQIAYIRDLMLQRVDMIPEMKRRGMPMVWPQVVLCIDEWGALISVGQTKGAEKIIAAAADTAVAEIELILQTARQMNISVILAMQDVLARSVSTKALGNIQARIVTGVPSEGTGGHLMKLFNDSERKRAEDAVVGITRSMQGRGICADENGEVQQFQSIYVDSANAKEVAAAIARASKPRRIGFEFPDDNGAWMKRSLWAEGDLEPIDTLPVIPLDDADGNPIPEHARYDVTSEFWDPGSPPRNSAHTEYTRNATS
ncbi:hypothetical protein [Mycobacteroides abscessus]|uniref:hypothetical protein n=1 Tax=Mycobacteroides abscessus TaxID=36809 RepID=UPI0009288F87|nr:hypothetical protein [Mycobacteroides abscessus]MBN7296639.1 hypothetical protein [Mycobacteroides abscessus subsp. abscessus]SHR97622.1 ftsk/SpoIIIE family protein, putative [Mycobacteroides abscessus subsp. abscessus]